MSRARYAVFLTARAEDDLRQIVDYYVRNGAADQALALIDSISTRIASLDEFPERGSVPPEVRKLGVDDVRQLLIQPFRIFYLVEPGVVSIFMIADGRRDIESLLEQRIVRD